MHVNIPTEVVLVRVCRCPIPAAGRAHRLTIVQLTSPGQNFYFHHYLCFGHGTRGRASSHHIRRSQVGNEDLRDASALSQLKVSITLSTGDWEPSMN